MEEAIAPIDVGRGGDATSALSLELARLHWRTEVGARLRLAFGTTGGRCDEDQPVHGALERERVRDLVDGAGFRIERITAEDRGLFALATRTRSVPDTVGPGMHLLVCGLNPSEYAADAGVGFARPGNRFWPAAIAAGLVEVDRNPLSALRVGIGMTDLVKRATARADDLTTDEYEAGLTRVERLVGWLRPGAVCFVGLAGWRAVVDRSARPGPIAGGLGGRPGYLMPSTSGANASSSLEDLVDHLRTAASMRS